MMVALPADLDRCLHAGFILGWGEPTVTDPLRRWLDGGLGGVILHTRNIVDADQLRELIGQMRRRQPDLLVTVDQEGGGIGHLARAGAIFTTTGL